MADRYPLIVDSSTGTVKELPSGDNLNVSGGYLVGVTSILSSSGAGVSFDGPLYLEGASVLTIKNDGPAEGRETNLAIGSSCLDNITSGKYNIAIGQKALQNATTAENQIAIGYSALGAQTGNSTGGPLGVGSSNFNNIAIGKLSQASVTSGHWNISIGNNSLRDVTTGWQNIAIGLGAGANLEGTSHTNVLIGMDALAYLNAGNQNIAIGGGALRTFTGSQATAVGEAALRNLITGERNSAFGYNSLIADTTGFSNSAFGYQSLQANTTGNYNCAFGDVSLQANTYGNDNTAFGRLSLYTNTTGSRNTAIGVNAFGFSATGDFNTALGADALLYNQAGGASTGYDNTTGIGSDARVSGSNQVQLGNSATTTYVYGTVQNRSDERDKADIRDTELGLDFIASLRPVDFKWDYRDDYFVKGTTTETREEVDESLFFYNEEGQAISHETGEVLETLPTTTVTVTVPSITALEKDGSKKRNRYHHGLIAQEVKSIMDAQGIDFGGYQDHSIAGGLDVLSIGYEELIAPLIKAVQELKAENDALKARVDALGG